MSSKLDIRYTQDITLDKEGSDAGNIEIRMKYLYLKLKPFDEGLLKNTFAEIGLVHRPYVDFEQKINTYRAKDKMFIEKAGIVNTADFGIQIEGLLGAKLSKEQQAKVGEHHAGTYGSFSVGLYNGGGYHAIEYNKNKTIEGRISVRPLPENITGLQFTYSGVYGKGNTNTNTDFLMSLFAVSYESPFFVLFSQYFFGKGDYKGMYIDDAGFPASAEGYSIFAECKIPKTSFALFGRYDRVNSNQQLDYFSSGYFGGLSYRFLKSKVFVYYGKDLYTHEEKELFEIVLELTF